jgi:hypothetical protein
VKASLVVEINLRSKVKASLVVEINLRPKLERRQGRLASPNCPKLWKKLLPTCLPRPASIG